MTDFNPIDIAEHNSNAGVSRRRLAFRPQSLNAPNTSVVSNILRSASGKPLRLSAESIESPCKSEPILNNAILSTPDQLLAKKSMRRFTTWNLNETMIFYEGLKQYGKDFEAISNLLRRKKMDKDRDQIRSFFFNAFKCWSTAAKIEEDDWNGVPRDARELFVVLNGCEWKKRTMDSKFHPTKFKSLIFEGNTSVRVRHRKQLLLIRTPYAPCLLKFFPYDKRNSEIPNYVKIQLKPHRYCDRNYVIDCQQNPFIVLKISINDKVTKLFEFLCKKWTTPEQKSKNEMNGEPASYEIKLHPTENMKLHKVHVEIGEDNGPPMSLNKLKKDYTAKTKEIETTPQNFALHENKRPSDNCVIKLQGAGIKEVFDIDDQTIQYGFKENDVKNATMLQLFYICGMKDVIPLEYELFPHKNPPFQPFDVFTSLINRDYAENIGKSIVNPITNEKTKQENKTEGDQLPASTAQQHLPLSQIDEQTSITDVGRKRRLSKSTNQETDKPAFESEDIVLNESQAFIRQWQELQAATSRKAKRVVRSVPSMSSLGVGRQPKRQIFAKPAQPIKRITLSTNAVTPRLQTMAQPISSASDSTYTVAYMVPTQSGQLLTIPAQSEGKAITTTSDQNHVPTNLRELSLHHLVPSNSVSVAITKSDDTIASNATDFSSLLGKASDRVSIESETIRSQETTVSQHELDSTSVVAAPSGVTIPEIQGTGGECSIDGTATVASVHSFHDGSPTKTLPEDVRQLYLEMLQQNSIDYCRNFEQLAKTIESPSKKNNVPESSSRR